MMWCHTTDLAALREILHLRVMRPQPCHVFKEDLTYMFYGRPAYRFKDDKPLLDEYAWPVILVFTNDIERLGKVIYPFDSGAFENKRYSRWLKPEWKIDDFALDIVRQSHATHVGAFYSTNDRYLLGNGKHFERGSFGFAVEAAAIAKMIRESHEAAADDRRIAVELILDKDIPIDSKHLKGIIVPAELIGEPELASIQAEGVLVYPYRLITHQTAREHHRLLEDEVYKLLEANKCL